MERGGARKHTLTFRSWYLRVMEALADKDTNMDLQYTDWKSQAKIMPLN